MFVVIKESGEYEDRCVINICLVESKEIGEKIIDLAKKLDSFLKEQNHLLYTNVEKFRNTLPYKDIPNHPKKSVIDPQNLISQKDWIDGYLAVYDKKRDEVLEFNSKLNFQVADFVKNNQPIMPEEFKIFQSEMYINGCYESSDISEEYRIEELKILKI